MYTVCVVEQIYQGYAVGNRKMVVSISLITIFLFEPHKQCKFISIVF